MDREWPVFRQLIAYSVYINSFVGCAIDKCWGTVESIPFFGRALEMGLRSGRLGYGLPIANCIRSV